MAKGGFLIFGLLNFALLVAALFFYLRKPVKKYISSRSIDLNEKRTKVFKDLNKAEERLDGHVERLRRINEEMNNVMSEAEKEGEKEGENMVIEVEKKADHLITQAMRIADHEVKRKNITFYRSIADKSVERAEGLIRDRLTREKQIEFIREFLNKLAKKSFETKEV